MEIRSTPSPNFGERKNDGTVDMLVLHYTGFDDIQGWIAAAQDPDQEKSAHYAIDETGVIYQLVEESKRAWHCGVSYWQGETDLNSCSIGIELNNPGMYGSGAYPDFPDAQIEALETLCLDILTRHRIPSSRVLGHSDIAIGRKPDPGEKCPWQRLAEKGIGLWPDPVLEDQVAMDHIMRDVAEQKKLFKEFGYDVSCDFGDVVTAFQRHFQPDAMGTQEQGQVSETTMTCLKALLRQAKL